MGRAELAIVIVSYNVRQLLGRCLRSLQAALDAADRPATIIVVDNASQDGSAALVRQEFPQVRLLALDRNLGFAGGNNVALRWLGGASHAIGSSISSGPGPEEARPDPSYVLLLNPDTEVVDGALERMLAYLEAHAEAAVIGPQLRYGDGTPQSSMRRWPTIGTLFWESTPLEQCWPSNPWAQRYRYGGRSADTVQTVDWLVGAALLVRWSAVERAGLLDERFFMYSEELEWQARLARYGTIVYLPDALIMHHEGKSSEQNLARRHINFSRSKLRYARLRWGRSVAWSLRLFLLAGYGVQLLTEAAKWLLGHKRPLRQQRIAQYRAILRSGL